MKSKFIIVLFLLTVVFVWRVAPVQATVGGKGCANTCSFNCNCGQCKGGGCVYKDGKQCCPYCFLPSCDELGMDSSCPAGCGNCETKTVKCACGNGGSRTCYKCGGGKPPNNPPENPPTPTAPPPTPTPVQPTVIQQIPPPPSDAFDAGSGADDSPDSFNEIGKYWVCLDSKPCSNPASGCSGKGEPAHRVKIQNKENTQLKLPDTPTYVLECVSPDQKSYRCTTGDQELDARLLLKGSHLQSLQADYGYEFTSYTDMGGNIINQSAPELVPKTTQEGKFGPYEWQSSTKQNVWRLMMSMQYASGGGDTSGNAGALQQAATKFIFDKNAKDCIIIQWDPRGTVTDADTGKPIQGVQVRLLVKNKNGNYELMIDKMGLIANPVFTGIKGSYQFLVPPGTYKIEAAKKGYRLVTHSKASVDHVYDGGEIVTTGELKTVNIVMKRDILQTVIDTVSDIITP